MSVVLRFNPLQQHPPAQDVATDQSHQHGMFKVVIECVAPADILDGAPRERAKVFTGLVVAGAETLPEIVDQELAELPGGKGGDRFHHLSKFATARFCSR